MEAEHSHLLITSALLLLACSVMAVAMLQRIGLPAILGYLFVGVLAGPHALGWLPDDATIGLLAEVGLAFLLFSIGLDFSLAQLLAMRRAVLGLGGAQVLLSALAVMSVALALDAPWEGALVLGGALAMSSTAIVITQLHAQLELRSRHGRLAFGVLLFQDLAVVPFLVIIPILASPLPGGLAMPLLIALGKGALAFFGVFVAGHWLLRPLFQSVARSQSSELFTLTALLVALAAAWITSSLQLSLALGAFLAGMVLSETEYRHQIDTSVRPFKDILMGLFFIVIGLKLDLVLLAGSWFWVLLLALGIVLGKGVLIYTLTRAAGYAQGVALRAGLVLAQGGEFGFALLALGVTHGLLPLEGAQLVVAAMVLSMVVAPLLIRHNGLIAKRFYGDRYLHERFEQVIQVGAAAREHHDHVIICGYGRIGQNLASFLRSAGLDYVALDLDPVLVREAWEAGEPVFYGDSTHVELLIAAGLNRARALVVTIENPIADERIVEIAHRQRPELPILVRIHDESRFELLERLGASDIVPDSVEASLNLATYLLQRLGMPTEQLLNLVERARQGHYEQLRGVFRGEAPVRADPFDRYSLHTVVLDEVSWAVGRTLGELSFSDKEVHTRAIRRSGIRGEAPDPSIVLRPGDAIVLEGIPERIAQAEHRLHNGP
jgi:CPA2 family monovalent cation:H+ antiporter-2